MTTRFLPILALAAGTTVSGCSFIARGPDQYRTDTRALLETRSAQVKACHDAALKTDATASGKVVVKFTVEKKTGTIKDVALDEGQTAAPAALAQCITDAMNGLQLTPEDQRDGQATFTYTFTVNPPAAPAAG
jgi:hypothetical protein